MPVRSSRTSSRHLVRSRFRRPAAPRPTAPRPARRRAGAVAVVASSLLPLAAPSAAEVDSGRKPPAKAPVAVGYGGAVASVDPYASHAGLEVLRAGGNAVDAAVATAAALGVVEPYSAGVGGGGYLVVHDARTGGTHTLDGRETAPAAMRPDSFTDPATGAPIPFRDAVTSGLSVGVPGTPATWEKALAEWGTISLAKALRPAVRLAERGFVVDEEFRAQTELNEDRFRDFTPTADLFLPGGELPEVGSVFRNPDLAGTYRLLAREGTDALYRGRLGREVVRTVRRPPVVPGADRTVRPGLMATGDLDRYRAPYRKPTRVEYRGVEVYSMAPSSSGGTTVGEALNILEESDPAGMGRVQTLHHYLEASRLAYADRDRWVGDPAFSDVPTEELLSRRFARERACLIDPDRAMTGPVAPADPRDPRSGECVAGEGGDEPYEGTSTTHLVTADRWGTVVSYTLTIEQTGGSAITVPGRGFLLNNELTDFDFTPLSEAVDGPNLPGPGKRPRSSMAPTIVLRDGRPLLALGSPGGSTIITTVLQTLVNRLDLGMTLPRAVAAPRLSQRNTATTQAEPEFLESAAERAPLERLGHRFVPPPATFTPSPEIGAVAALEVLADGRLLAVAEPERRGGGSAMVSRPTRR
ncbi:gamma-glutamyltransferase [Streptomyces sp. TRM43335]|uniref:Glutathione hydrolase proenzyme n=1 Tax=Streptomyces taklimakanensis TaxID=2569853 RepID=A0A6G2BHR5_9ACTN|nr:gamma-glutamyltransferase [Streptomyces taklimakanensis]MTE21790.1 gamma-glutamyltransferase [Streptomyces taklimakanensis]